jgi:hypothetical protein
MAQVLVLNTGICHYNNQTISSTLTSRQYRSIIRDCQEQLDGLAETASAAQVRHLISISHLRNQAVVYFGRSVLFSSQNLVPVMKLQSRTPIVDSYFEVLSMLFIFVPVGPRYFVFCIETNKLLVRSLLFYYSLYIMH